jgi:hypothetical protein
MRGRAWKAWLVILALWTGGVSVMFVVSAAHGRAGLTRGLLAGGAIVLLFSLIVLAVIRATGDRRE